MTKKDIKDYLALLDDQIDAYADAAEKCKALDKVKKSARAACMEVFALLDMRKHTTPSGNMAYMQAGGKQKKVDHELLRKYLTPAQYDECVTITEKDSQFRVK